MDRFACIAILSPSLVGVMTGLRDWIKDTEIRENKFHDILEDTKKIVRKISNILNKFHKYKIFEHFL